MTTVRVRIRPYHRPHIPVLLIPLYLLGWTLYVSVMGSIWIIALTVKAIAEVCKLLTTKSARYRR